jgi:hypothetical protein
VRCAEPRALSGSAYTIEGRVRGAPERHCTPMRSATRAGRLTSFVTQCQSPRCGCGPARATRRRSGWGGLRIAIYPTNWTVPPQPQPNRRGHFVAIWPRTATKAGEVTTKLEVREVM